MEELRENFDEWRETFECKGMRVNFGKTKLIVNGVEEKTFDSKIDPWGVIETRVMSNSMLCTTCGKYVGPRKIHGYEKESSLFGDFVCKKCGGMVINLKGPDKILCDGAETATKFSYLGDRLNATGKCKTSVTARTRID